MDLSIYIQYMIVTFITFTINLIGGKMMIKENIYDILMFYFLLFPFLLQLLGLMKLLPLYLLLHFIFFTFSYSSFILIIEIDLKDFNES